MPRDDLSIDFVKRMPQGGENLDPAMILDDWINRVSNLPEEIRFIQDEIAEKDKQYNECIKTIEERDNRIQKWIKANSSHENNPREEGYRTAIRENYIKAERLSAEKITLTQKLQVIMDKHIRQLDMQIKLLYDRNEPGFTDPDEVPSLLRPSAANHSAPSARSVNPAANHVTAPLNPITNSATPVAARVTPVNPQVRTTQTQQSHPVSAPATPAASMILNRQTRESSAGPGSGAPKRGPRVNSGLGTAPTTSSGLARHSSLGPGTPKALHTAAGVQRAGSAGPRSTTKGAGTGPGRKTWTASAGVGRKKSMPAGAGTGSGPGNKSNLSRVKRPAKNSPSSTADSELSEAESGSGSNASSRRGTPARGSAGLTGTNSSNESNSKDKNSSNNNNNNSNHNNNSNNNGPGEARAATTSSHRHHNHPHTKREKDSHAAGDDDDAQDVDDDEAGDDKKYCLCQNVSFGDMVACDNDDCPYEWFHWSCVGLKSEPNGTWYCPVCTEKMNASKKGK